MVSHNGENKEISTMKTKDKLEWEWPKKYLVKKNPVI